MTPHTDRQVSSDSLDSIYIPLKLCFGLVPIVAGLDKFTNILTDWSQYLPGFASDLLPVSPSVFMMVVGVIEIVAGVLVLTRLTRLGAAVVAAWLVGVGLSAALAGFLDVAVRDVVMAFGAYALSALAAVRGAAWLPLGGQERSATQPAGAR